jgi:hypothetical protein
MPVSTVVLLPEILVRPQQRDIVPSPATTTTIYYKRVAVLFVVVVVQEVINKRREGDDESMSRGEEVEELFVWRQFVCWLAGSMSFAARKSGVALVTRIDRLGRPRP